MDTNNITYWVAGAIHHDNCLNVRAETEEEVVALVENEGKHSDIRYLPPKEVTVTFTGAFDLLDRCLEECGAWEDG